MLATQSIRFSNEYIEFWKLNPNFPQTNQKCNLKIAPTTDHQKRPKLSRKREPKKKDFVEKRKSTKPKSLVLKIIQNVFSLDNDGLFWYPKGKIVIGYILQMKIQWKGIDKILKIGHNNKATLLRIISQGYSSGRTISKLRYKFLVNGSSVATLRCGCVLYAVLVRGRHFFI